MCDLESSFLRGFTGMQPRLAQMFTLVVPIGLALVLMGVGAPASAFECAIVSKEPAEVTVSDRLLVLPAERVADCRDARVVRGTVVACALDARGRSRCGAFNAGQSLSAERLGSGQAIHGAWFVLGDLLKGSPSRVDARSRGGHFRSPLPTGPVVLLSEEIAVDFTSQPELRKLEYVEVRRDSPDGPVVARFLPDQEGGGLSVNQIVSATTYHWSTGGRLPLRGRFSVVGEAQRAEAKAEAARIREDARDSLDAQALMLAGWLQANDFSYEAAGILLRAGFTVEP